MRHRRAFTLIELLVVISVIAVLAALVMPVISRAMQAAERTSCANNIHQICTLMMQYVANWKGLYPALDQSDYVIASAPCWHVPNQCYNFPFLDQLRACGDEVLFCPSEPYSEWHRRTNRSWAWQWGLGYCLYGGHAWPWYREHVGPYTAGVSPARSRPDGVLITDIVRNWCGPWVRSGVHMNNHYRPDTYAPTGGHAGFVDGHVRWTAADDLDWDRRYNNANLQNSPTDPGWNFCVGFQP